jgi:transcriptional regulator with XRE-family HTH domain
MRYDFDEGARRRLRQRRWMLGVTQQQLARQVGITVRELQEYETTADAVCGIRLHAIAEVLETPVTYLLHGDLDRLAETPHCRGRILDSRQAKALVGAYYALGETQRRQLSGLVDLVSEMFGVAPDGSGETAA